MVLERVLLMSSFAACGLRLGALALERLDELSRPLWLEIGCLSACC